MLSTLRKGATRATVPRVASHARAVAPRMATAMRHSSSWEDSNPNLKSWVPMQEGKMQEAVKLSLIHNLSKSSLDIAESVVPWYLSNLPDAYWKEAPEATRMQHLNGLSALKGISHQQDMTLSLRGFDDENNRSVLTVLHTSATPGSIYNMMVKNLSTISTDTLQAVRCFEAFDKSLTLNIFSYGDASSQQGSSSDVGAVHLQQASSEQERAAIAEFLSHCHPTYAAHTNTTKFERHRKMYETVRGTDRVECRVDGSSSDTQEISYITSSSRPEEILTKIAQVLPLRGLNVVRLQMDMLTDPENPIGNKPGNVCLVRILVNESENGTGFPGFKDLNGQGWKDFLQDLRRLKWLDANTLDLGLKDCPDLGVKRAEVITGLIAMLHGPLSKVNPFTYSRPNLNATVRNNFYTHYFSEIADLFLARFNPDNPLPSEQFEAQAAELRNRLSTLTNESARIAMLKFVDAVEHTKRTNFFIPSRYALAFRLDPSLMINEDQEKPFGAIFVHGNGFDGFHNRFRNIARGGLRLVSPNSAEQYAMESSRCYDEVYGLSYAQQLKNKDIPEGGSKAVCLVDMTTVSPAQKHRTLRNSVRGFSDAMLDLIVSTNETRPYMVDHLGFDELIYLGPDEQIIPEDIDWIIQHAGRRGYPIPAAFMSSKPLAGINHKVYGVTSEGVAVFLDVALRNNGINPNEDEFSVKITGGPDGDVAGNLMRILFREYGNKVKIVGVADGSGCAEDPAGLSHSEMMRLFKEEKPIGDMDRSTLSAQGSLLLADNEEGIRMRNSMYNRVKADVFVPAGGRPNTIHEGNWHNFLDESTGVPSSPLFVEGANIFTTPGARKKLFEEAGVQIVKDSSANKCGVITSSYEICASMLLDEQEFLAIKEELVEDVLTRLRELARMEAELLFREHNKYSGNLPDTSQRISAAINKATDAIAKELAPMQQGDEMYNSLLPIFLQEHLPRKLSEVAGSRVPERIPLDYLRSAFASSLASKILYKEGTHFLESTPADRIAKMAIEYYHMEKHVSHLLETVSSSQMPDTEKAQVLHLLNIGGTRSALDDA